MHNIGHFDHCRGRIEMVAAYLIEPSQSSAGMQDIAYALFLTCLGHQVSDSWRFEGRCLKQGCQLRPQRFIGFA